MFGYTVPLYSKLTASNLAVYRRYYCEGCHQLKAQFGLLSTATVNYDMTFNTLILNAVTGDALDFERTKNSPLCVFKKPGADSDLMRDMAAYTVLLTKWELVDDSVDKPSLKSNLASLALNRAIRKAERLYPEYDEAVGKGFDELRSLEEAGCTDAAMMGRTFGDHLTKALNEIAGEHSSDPLKGLFSDLTAIVYIMDAVDDLDQDYLDGTYNPFLKDCEDYLNKKEYIARHIYDITGTMNSVMGSLQSNYSMVKSSMRANIGVTDNIVYYGIPNSAKGILSGLSTAKVSLKSILGNHSERNASY
ncbi:MAG: DUF5685 family protein [Candidatus Methanoplasma sp.]|jgi:hypothetical protein|nr:DUF5685 family protein [Candidatus Methanoplasma sp.]